MARPLIVGVETTPTNFDMEQPEGFTNDVASDLFHNLYDQLTLPQSLIGDDGVRRVRWDPMRPVLAEAWWFSDDELTCTFRLRRGVFSHDGNELTAEDVKWGWERAFAMRDVGKWVARVSSVQNETDIEVLDRYTVAFHLAAPNPALPRSMAQCTPSVYDTGVVLAKRAADDPWGAKVLKVRPAGFGPYRLTSHSADETMLAAHDRYWRGRPAIDDVRVKTIRSHQGVLDAMRSGEIQLAIGISQDEASDLHREGIRIVAIEGTPGLVLHFDVSEPPFDDPIVRQAVACAIPYADIIQTAYLGVASRWRSYVQPQAPGYLDAWPYEENVARARQLLAESGHPNGLETRLVVRPGEGTVIAAQVMKDGLARIGVEVTIESDRDATREFSGSPKVNLGPMMLRSAGVGGRGNRVHDPIYALYHDHGPGRMRLFRYTFENEAFYEALKAIPTAGHASWDAAAKRAQQLLNEDATTVPICHFRSYVAHSKELTGYRWYPDNRLAFADLTWVD